MANASEDEIPWVEKIEIGYKKGLYIKTMDGNYSLNMHFLMQPQFYNLGADTASNLSTFILRHGQMRFFGNIINPKLNSNSIIKNLYVIS